MKDVVIAGYLRTAQSRSRPRDPGRDWLHKVRADTLMGKYLVPELLKRAKVDPKEVDDLIVGSAMGVSEQWTYGGRNIVLLANLPETVAAKFVDQQCGSAMAATHIGYMEIATGNADIVLTGGIEHMTRVPMGGGGDAIKPNMDLFSAEEYKHWGMQIAMNMGFTAEKLSQVAGIDRLEQEKWSARSHQRAAQAQKDGFFKGEILPIEVEQADGTKMIVDTDQAVRGDTTLEQLAQLKPAYSETGIITAGTSSPLNAAATSMLLMSKETAKKKGITPLATIRALGFAGVDPTIMGIGPVPASRKALAQIGLKAQDIDFWEINEAFSVVALNCIKDLGIDPEKVNVMGGGVAIGHPLGATGVRLIGTLARILNLKGGRYGCANACVGGGQGVATIIEREKY